MLFSQTLYSVNENAGSAQLILNLSNPSPTEIIVTVYNTNRSASGKYMLYNNSILIN